MQILRKVEETVYPAASNHPALHRLSETDQLRRYSVPQLFFYEQAGSVEALKSSLSKTLALFYPLAGRLVERSAESAYIGIPEEMKHAVTVAIDGRLDVSCLDQGAIFCEAWTDTRLDAYKPDFQPHPDFRLLVVPDHPHQDVLLQVQVTHFSCGGICLCVQAHHSLLDGASCAQFMECWVDFTNGKESLVELPYIRHPPLEVMYRVKGTPSPSKEDRPITSPLGDGDQVSKVRSHEAQIVLNKVFHFTSAFIETLKNENIVGGYKYSRFECIVAYLWRKIIIAKEFPFHEEVSLCYVVDGRRRLKPSLPQSYMGNVIFKTHASIKVGDLVDKPLSHIALLLRESTSKITNEHMRSILEGLLRKASPANNFPMMMPKDFFFTSWISFSLCDLDFGWGKPIYCRIPQAFPNFGVMMPSSLGKGHIDVCVGLEEKHMYRLEALLSQSIVE